MSETSSLSSIKDWRPATVISVAQAADDMLSVKLKPDYWIDHKAGQHYELRLPGHHLSRKYSVVSSPIQTDHLEFGIQLLSYGLVSPALWQLKAGDKVDIRGPLGAFIWTPDKTGPLLMIGAGSGITPLLSIYEYYKQQRPKGEVVLIVSAKSESRVMHYDMYQKQAVMRFTGKDGRLDEAFLQEHLEPFANRPDAYCLTCGPGGFTGSVIDMLLRLGFTEEQIRRESFH